MVTVAGSSARDKATNRNKSVRTRMRDGWVALSCRRRRRDRHIMSSFPKLNDVSIFPDNRELRHADEQTVFDDARNPPQLLCERRWVGDFAEIAVKDVMSFVGYVWVAIGISSQFDLRSQGLDLGFY